MGNYLSSTSATTSPTATSNESQATATVQQGTATTKKYGWRRDKPDFRDKYRNFHYFSFLATPNIDLREGCPHVYNQGKLGSCTANAIAGAYEFDQIKQGEKKPFTPSRLFIYFNERDMEGNIDKDAGAEIRDGIKSINNVGVCPEVMWPYDISKFTDKPSDSCYTDAKEHEAVQYHRVKQDIDHLRQCLCEGYPFVFGFAVYESFESEDVAKTGVMPMPKKDEKLLGGHAVMAVGFDDLKERFIVRNSWGSEWGDDGYFYMPYDFISNQDLCADFWTVTRVQDEGEE